MPDRRKCKMKFPHFSAKDQKKACKVVSDIVENPGDYVCLSCNIHLDSFSNLMLHKKKCTSHKMSLMMGAKMERTEPTVEPVENDSDLSKYVTGW